MKKITIKEIAKQAGVSVGTVDRVLHNRGEVAEATKKLVLEIAKKGNYSTNVYARNLKLNKVYQLAVIIPNDNEYWKTQKLGIENAAKEFASLGIQLHYFSFDRHEEGAFQKQSESALNSKPNGVIMAPVLEKEASGICNSFSEMKIPIVLVDSNLENANPLAFIGQESFKSGYLAAKLLNFGHPNGLKTIIIRYNEFDSLNKTIEERIAGFKNFYIEKVGNHEMVKELVIDNENDDITSLIAHLISESEPVYLFVPNSRAHLVVNKIANLFGKKIIRIVGYDLISENITYLKNGKIDFIINQNPKLQGQLSVQAFHKTLILNTDVKKEQFMPIEIVTAENVDFVG